MRPSTPPHVQEPLPLAAPPGSPPGGPCTLLPPRHAGGGFVSLTVDGPCCVWGNHLAATRHVSLLPGLWQGIPLRLRRRRRDQDPRAFAPEGWPQGVPLLLAGPYHPRADALGASIASWALWRGVSAVESGQLFLSLPAVQTEQQANSPGRCGSALVTTSDDPDDPVDPVDPVAPESPGARSQRERRDSPSDFL